MYVRTYVRMYVCMYVCIVCTVRMYVCVYVRTYERTKRKCVCIFVTVCLYLFDRSAKSTATECAHGLRDAMQNRQDVPLVVVDKSYMI